MPTIKVPKKIKAMHHPYALSLQRYIKDDDGMLGWCNTRTQKIAVDNSLPNSQRTYVLMHEILEAYKDAMGFPIEHNSLDSASKAFAHFLTETLGIKLDWSNIPCK